MSSNDGIPGYSDEQKQTIGYMFGGTFKDEKGRNVIIIRAGGMKDTEVSLHRKVSYVYQFISEAYNPRKPNDQFIWVIDVEGWSVPATSADAFKHSVKELQMLFIGKLASFIVFNCTPVFRKFWQAFESHLPPKTLGKFVLIDDNEFEDVGAVLRNYFDLECVPCRYGGGGGYLNYHGLDYMPVVIFPAEPKPDSLESGPLAAGAKSYNMFDVKTSFNDDEQKLKIQELKNSLGLIATHAPNLPFSKFLEAWNWNVEDADAMIRKSVHWRANRPGLPEFNWAAIDCEIAKMFGGAFYDEKGRLVLIIRAGGLKDTESLPMQFAYLIGIIEIATLRLRKGYEYMRWVIDLEGWSLPLSSAYAFKDFVKVLQDSCPDILGGVIMCNCTLLFQKFWVGFRTHLEQETLPKFVFADEECKDIAKVLLDYFDPGYVPFEYGGLGRKLKYFGLVPNRPRKTSESSSSSSDES